VLYTGEEKIGASWQDFREKYVEFGGDGFYGAWSVPYLEPVISDRKYVRRCPQIYSDVYYKEGLCPVAEQLQPKLMQFKTNYRSIERAKEKVESLKKTINYYKRSK
jgi:perosamine synthetase